ncbi:MAG TPA: ATP-binding cassette domain-containing protein [Atopobiaceae bacterium]|nr:ATP-binding cassette domain-containing protein [Atopobiaceae bacterium]
MSAAVEIRDLSFRYPGCPDAVFEHAALTVDAGSFAVLSGPTGSGKTTLLRLLKPEIAPAGELSGERRVFGSAVEGLGLRASAENIAFVFQDPENQIVCDTVWHELAFGLENLGVPADEMRLRVAETCTYLGIGPWFRMRCTELSGGQQQVLALAAALTMRPRLILLDEPTSMLDPVAEKEFLALLFRANRELGTTVIVATHRAEAYRPYATEAFMLEGGQIQKVPLASLVSARRGPGDPAPVAGDCVVRLSDLWFRYRRDSAWVLRGFDLALGQGEMRALVGGNASGKSTVLALISGMHAPQRGRCENGLASSQAYLPQNPKALLARETVEGELAEWAPSCGYGEGEIAAALERTGLSSKRESHPYDLSGGQQQLLALEKLLLTRPRLLLLDEPTKGLDAASSDAVAQRLEAAQASGATILLATHDFAFVRRRATKVTLLFDGQAAATLPRDAFFSRSWLLGAGG